MAGSAAYARIKTHVLNFTMRIPSGRVATHKQIGVHLNVMPRHVASILATIDDLEREAVPWWRVVADGGAVGRHVRRDEQVQRLRAEGTVLSAAGIVQDLRERWIEDVDALMTGRIKPQRPAAAAGPEMTPSRSRGMRASPKSSV